MKELVVATRNAGKLREIRHLLEGVGIAVLGLDAFPAIPEIEEDGDTFAANAAKKAETVARLTGRPCLADDSGLTVEALGGAPGVHSARYAGVQGDDAANNARLLRELGGVPPETASGGLLLCHGAECPRRGHPLLRRPGRRADSCRPARQ